MSPDNPSLFSESETESQVLPDNILSDKVINWLAELYDLTDWRCVLLDGTIDHEYDGVPISSYFKALVLPYLVNIPPSERALGRIILDRNNLQKLCGFRVGYPLRKHGASDDNNKPMLGSRTFWHFRNKYKEVYSELITKTLISLVLSGKYPNLNFPFVEKIQEKDFNNDGNLISWTMDAYRPTVIISLPWSERNLLTEKDVERFEDWKAQWRKKFSQCKDMIEYRALKIKYDEEYKGYARRSRKGFTEEITFPIDVSISLDSKEKLFFRLINPNWLNKDAGIFQVPAVLNETAKGSFQKNIYDKACNILVIRENKGDKEILLSRRRVEGKGEGNFAVPGGKQKEGETLEKCAIRELNEETGLTLEKSRPISLYYTLQASGKQIMSVGVLAESWVGQVETKEPDKHLGWDWYKLEDLPKPIFEFTRIAVLQFTDNKYPNLTWDDLEEKPDTQLSMFDVPNQ